MRRVRMPLDRGAVQLSKIGGTRGSATVAMLSTTVRLDRPLPVQHGIHERTPAARRAVLW